MNSFQGQKIRITKLDSARRQLRTAIELWFKDGGDEVSVLSLAYASHEIIHRLYRRKGLSDLLYDSKIVKDEYRKEWGNLLKEWPNFVKHAERESKADDAIDLHPGAGLLFMVMSVTGLDRMGEARSDFEDAFMFWLYLHNPSWFPENVAKERIPVERLTKLRAMNKEEFLKGFLEVRREQRARGLGPDGRPLRTS